MRKLLLNNLINIYKNITYAIDRMPIDEFENFIFFKYFEDALTDIQLFGTQKQIDICFKMIDDFNKDQKFSFNELLTDLRSDIRKDLGLEEINYPIIPIRFKPNKDREENNDIEKQKSSKGKIIPIRSHLP